MRRLVIAASAALAAACGTSEGVFHATWSIERANPITPLACSDVGADTVAVLVNEIGAQTYHEDDLPCADMTGTTPAYPYAAYNVSVSLLGGGTRVGTTAPVTLHLNADTIDLPKAVFDF